MAFKFVAFCALVAVARAGVLAPVGYAAPLAYAAPIAKVATPVITKIADDYDPNPQYSYSYDIQDALTGDSKNQHETRNGDVVEGSYSLTDPDGLRRTVDYTADPINGFNAVVRREPLGVAVKAVAAPAVLAKVATPVAYAAPAFHHHHAVAPLAYAAPVAKYAAPLAYAAPTFHHHAAPLAYAAPVAKYAAAPLAYPSYIH